MVREIIRFLGLCTNVNTIDVPFALWREINQVPALLYYRSTNKQEPLKYITSLEFKDLKDFLIGHGATLQKVKSDD
jgi:hypothetical protein